jgi:hypothetical protein
LKHVVALSGGKDSTALALWLVENEPRDYQFVCTPTGDELPEMIEHWISLGQRLGSRILPVTGGKGLSALIREYRSLPNNRQRWCTRRLKLEPYYRWLGEQAPAVSYVGLRADESDRQGMIFPEANGITLRFPLREQGFTEADVWAFLDERQVKIPARTDCARCYDQTLGEWWRLWKMHPGIFDAAVLEEEWVCAERGQTFTFRSPSRDTWPAALRDLRAEFESGRVPPRTVQQIDMFNGERRRVGICRLCSL